MSRIRVTNLYTYVDDVRVTVAAVGYDYDHDNSLVTLDLVPMVTACRAWGRNPFQQGNLMATGLPVGHIDDPPLLQGDIQETNTTKARKKIGWLWTKDDEHGEVTYHAAFDHVAILKLFDAWHCHVHCPTSKEMDDELAGRSTQK